MAGFTMNAALVAGQWQHCTWSFPLPPSINVKHYAGQATLRWLTDIWEKKFV